MGKEDSDEGLRGEADGREQGQQTDQPEFLHGCKNYNKNVDMDMHVFFCFLLCFIPSEIWPKGMDIKDLVDIVILRYDHWPQFFFENVLSLGKWPIFYHI